MENEPAEDARDLVTELFPQARWALLTGSVTTAHRTAGSDLDIVVMLPDGDPAAPHRDSRHYRGWPAELFVHDAASLAHYLAKELPSQRPVLHQMVAMGVPLLGDPSSTQDECRAVLDKGPGLPGEAERDRARYMLTDQIDELTHNTDPGEQAVIAAVAWLYAGQQTLALAGRWVAHGKWLIRDLRAYDPDVAIEWLAAQGNPAAIIAYVETLLVRHGGPLFAGYTVPGERPSS